MQIIHQNHTQYPSTLQKIAKPPEELYVEGNAELLQKDCIAVVGSRANTDWGEAITREFVKAFVQAGLVVVSGMATGIDSIAHTACMQYGGKTIAVLGCGLQNITTKHNVELLETILQKEGAVITEYPPEEPGRAIHFPARNRIISGLSLAVFVVEAAYRSGTSITARKAMEQGKNVYCLPQEREASKGVGTNHLLQIGAKLITKPEEILQDLGVLSHTVPCQTIENNVPEEERRIFEELQKGNRTPTQLSIALGQPIAIIQSLLMKMELEDKIKKDRMGRWIQNE